METLLGFIFLLFLGFVIFFIYFVFKQIEFVFSAVNLYKDMISREDKIIDLLREIKQHHIENGKMFKQFVSHQLDTMASIRNSTQVENSFVVETAQNEQGKKEHEQEIQNVKINVYKRGTVEEDAEIIKGQNLANDAIPIKVRTITENNSIFYSIPEFWRTINCPYCNKPYSVNVTSPNLQFQCVKCHNFMLAVIAKSDIPSEIYKQPPPLPEYAESKPDVHIASDLSQSAQVQNPETNTADAFSQEPPQFFKVVFSGEIQSEKNLEAVKQQFMGLYKGKYTITEISQLFFCGKPITIKSQLLREEAMKFQENLTTRTGAKFTIESM